jgi:hypothetical protein
VVGIDPTVHEPERVEVGDRARGDGHGAGRGERVEVGRSERAGPGEDRAQLERRRSHGGRLDRRGLLGELDDTGVAGHRQQGGLPGQPGLRRPPPPVGPRWPRVRPPSVRSSDVIMPVPHPSCPRRYGR